MPTSWVPVLGKFEFEADRVTYKGEMVEWEGNAGEGLGIAVASGRLAGGAVAADVTFSEIGERTGCELVVYGESDKRIFVTAGVGLGPGMFAIRHYDGNLWRDLAVAGDRGNMKPNRQYRIRAVLRGSRVTLEIDDVHVLTGNISFSPSQGQVGVICIGRTDTVIENFHIEAEKAKAFVIMQFSSPFDDIHREVIKIICEEFNLEAVRADESYKPAIIISEIAQQIAEAKVIIAEITPANPSSTMKLAMRMLSESRRSFWPTAQRCRNCHLTCQRGGRFSTRTRLPANHASKKDYGST